MIRKIRRGRGTFMGMDVLVLHTVGRHSGQPRETPVAWFADDDGARLIVASGGGRRHRDWHANLMAPADRASITLPGSEATPVTPHRLDGAERERAWQRVTARPAPHREVPEQVRPAVPGDPARPAVTRGFHRP